MGTQGIVVQPGQGQSWEMAPGPSATLELLGDATGGSVTLFEETVPVGTKSTFHLHHDSDEVAWVLDGEITFLIGDEITVGGPGTCAFMPRGVRHAWKNSGTETGRVVFLCTPASAGAYVEALQRARSAGASLGPDEGAALPRAPGLADRRPDAALIAIAE